MIYSNKYKLDKFYTKKNIANLCINEINNLNEFEQIIEPSVGSGSFYNILKNKNLNVIGIDLEPEKHLLNDENIIQCSWFDYNVLQNKKTLVIGNPPFGKMNKLSKEFIKHASSFDNVYTIAFILPNVYNKHTLQNSIPKKYRLKKIIELPKNSFTINKKDYHVPCSFFIFEKSIGKCLRFNPDMYKETKEWCFAKKGEGDFYILGASPKTVKNLNEVTPNNRGYYIKVKDKSKIEIIKNNFKKINWKGNSSTNGGVFWLTKPELVKNYIDNLNYNNKKE
jgi:predicted RNA methylase